MLIYEDQHLALFAQPSPPHTHTRRFCLLTLISATVPSSIETGSPPLPCPCSSSASTLMVATIPSSWGWRPMKENNTTIINYVKSCNVLCMSIKCSKKNIYFLFSKNLRRFKICT